MLDEAAPQPIASPQMSGCLEAGIGHGFFTRAGGVSTGLYGSLNVGLGSRDDRALVEENRRRVARHFAAAPQRLVTLHQVHSPDAIIVGPGHDGSRPRADALVTATPGLVIGVLTADCGPILLADARARIVAAAHAGWRGALAGIVDSTVAAMVRLGARRERIRAAIGPTISQENYEVGPDFIAQLSAAAPHFERYLAPSPRDGHALFDLPAFIAARLEAAGVAAETVGRCTYGEEPCFFSYRRSTHRREPDYGRQISAICIME